MPQVFLPQIQSVPRTGSEDEKFAALVREVNRTLSLLPWGVLQALSGSNGSLQFTKPLSMGKQAISNLAQAVSETDAVPLSQVEALIAESITAHLSSDDLATKVRLTEVSWAQQSALAANADRVDGFSILSGSATVNPGAIGALAVATFTVTVSGAVVGDGCFLGPPPGINAGLLWSAVVTGADQVEGRIYNSTAAPISPSSAIWKAFVVHAG